MSGFEQYRSRNSRPVTLPILHRHDARQVIGQCEPTPNGLVFTFIEGRELTIEQVHACLGNIGYAVNEWVVVGTRRLVKQLTVKEFSVE